MKQHGTFIVFGLTLGLFAFFRGMASNSNEHVRLAYALTQGHLYVDGLNVWEHVRVLGHDYTLHPPLAALACLPFVLWFGIGANQTVIETIVGALAVALCWRFLNQTLDLGEHGEEEKAQRRDNDAYDDRADTRNVILPRILETHSLWLTAFFGLGTAIAYESTLGASWGFCLVLSCALSFLALTEVFGRRRAWLVGLWAGLAALARYDLALVWPVYFLLLRRDRNQMVAMLCGFVALYFIYNFARFGTIFDISLGQWFEADAAGGVKHWPHGPFSFAYLPLNLYTALFMGPNYSGDFPWVRPHAMGQSILLTSPAFLLALRPSFRRRETLLLWAAVTLGMSGALLVWSNGIEQFGCRYWIQAYPFLIALMARARLDQMGRTLIVASILFCTLGSAVIRVYGWPT